MKPSIEKNETPKFYHSDAELELRQITKSRMQSRQMQRILEGFSEKYVCPNCGASMRKSFGIQSMYYCPECLSSIETGEMNLDTNKICPNCGQFLDDENECIRCGYSLGRDFE
jgi:predicted amidophosphoribosyltransferase